MSDKNRLNLMSADFPEACSSAERELCGNLADFEELLMNIRSSGTSGVM